MGRRVLDEADALGDGGLDVLQTSRLVVASIVAGDVWDGLHLLVLRDVDDDLRIGHGDAAGIGRDQCAGMCISRRVAFS